MIGGRLAGRLWSFIGKLRVEVFKRAAKGDWGGVAENFFSKLFKCGRCWSLGEYDKRIVYGIKMQGKRFVPYGVKKSRKER